MAKKHHAAKHEHHSHHKKEGFIAKAKEFYLNEYKKLFLVLIGIFLISTGILVGNYMTTGEVVKRDVSLKGGISLVVNAEYADTEGLESFLTDRFPDASINFRTIEEKGKVIGIIIEASDLKENELLESVGEKITLTKDNYNVESMGSSLGDSFFNQMFIALLFAMILLGLVFQLYFRSLYATFAAIFSAFMDIFITFAVMTALDVRLTAGGIAAYLMLIGYSVDTSILLSTKLLKEGKEFQNAIFGAMKTGLTMSIAGIAATGVSYFLTNNETLKQIMLILIVGLIVDILTTWIGNVSFLRMKLEKKNE